VLVLRLATRTWRRQPVSVLPAAFAFAVSALFLAMFRYSFPVGMGQ
jgi:hypothetical protein